MELYHLGHVMPTIAEGVGVVGTVLVLTEAMETAAEVTVDEVGIE